MIEPEPRDARMRESLRARWRQGVRLRLTRGIVASRRRTLLLRRLSDVQQVAGLDAWRVPCTLPRMRKDSYGLLARESAERARLRYVDDQRPGLRRVRTRSGFRYVGTDGRPCSAQTVARIRALVIPPAWEDVWIAPSPEAHIQATGRDARGRKQYRYHARWRVHRDTEKYEKMVRFARALPRLREVVEQCLRRRSRPRERLLALMVRIMERTFVRVGNDEYLHANKSFGLTTFTREQVRIGKDGNQLAFHFRGKSGVERHVELRDRRTVRILDEYLRRSHAGEPLFCYLDAAGGKRRLRSSDLNQFIRDAAQCDLSAKDFRTWAAAVLAARLFASSETEKPTKKRATVVVKEVATHLGNTPAVCRRSYIHPAIFEAYENGTLGPLKEMDRNARGGLSDEEHFVRNILSSYDYAGARKREAA